MGKTKIKTIDDSQPVEEKSHSAPASPRLRGARKASQDKPAKNQEDALVEKLKEELGLEPETPKQVKKEAKTQKPGKSRPRSKKYLEASKNLDRSKTYPLPEALDMVKSLSYAKFNATLEAHILTAQTGLRGLVSLPYAAGKKTEFKTEAKAPVIHLALGKLNQPNEELIANVKQLITALGKTKIKKVTLSPTMGAGVKVDLTSI